MHEDNQTDRLRSYQVFHLDVKHNKNTLGLPSLSPTLIDKYVSFFSVNFDRNSIALNTVLSGLLPGSGSVMWVRTK